MESSLIQNQVGGVSSFPALSPASGKAQADAIIITDLQERNHDVRDAQSRATDSLSFTAKKVLEKLNEILAPHLPQGVQSLKPEDHTAEKTADRIVSQVTALYGAYAKQNANKDPEELLEGFMSLVRKGVDQGYEEAFSILEGIGAFEVEGVKSGVEETKRLIGEKLDAFEKYLSRELGITTEEPLKEENFEAPVTQSLLAQGGAQLNVAA